MFASGDSRDFIKEYLSGKGLHLSDDLVEEALIKDCPAQPAVLGFGKGDGNGFGFYFSRPDIATALLTGPPLKDTPLAQIADASQLLLELAVGGGDRFHSG